MTPEDFSFPGEIFKLTLFAMEWVLLVCNRSKREATFQNGRFFCSYSKGEKLQSLTLFDRLKYVSAKQGCVCLCTVVTAINNLIWTLEPSLTMR